MPHEKKKDKEKKKNRVETVKDYSRQRVYLTQLLYFKLHLVAPIYKLCKIEMSFW